jgi:hypothetical protein
MNSPTTHSLKSCSLNHDDSQVTGLTAEKWRLPEKISLNNAKTAQMRAVLLIV